MKHSLKMHRVIDEVISERYRQDEQWGGDEHDDKHSIQDFKIFIDKQLHGADRDSLIKVAALAIACVEMIDRKND